MDHRRGVFGRDPRGLRRWEQARAPGIANLILTHGDVRGGTALDVGCGSGAVAAALSSHFQRVVGVDRVARSPSTPALCGASPLLVVGCAERLPIRSASVDLVYSYGVLHHTVLERALGEVRRVLAPGGAAVLVDFVEDRRPGWPRVWRQAVAAVRAFAGYRARHGIGTAAAVTAFRLSPRWLAHVHSDRLATPGGFVATCTTYLPGVRFVAVPRRLVAVWRPRGGPAGGKARGQGDG